ncbi:MAG: biopolymer transporter ExbD [Bdellovibrionales bacterium]|nr:biopolymer transporter ExbD [Bdellovibrionales bacterium]
MQIRRARKVSTELEMAPLIDVVFLLLIFFLLTSSFIQSEAIELSLPQSESAAQTEEDQPLIVSVTSEGVVHFQEQEISLADLKAELSTEFSKDAERAVILRTDGETQVEAMVGVLDAVRLAGGTNVNIATQQKQG